MRKFRNKEWTKIKYVVSRSMLKGKNQDKSRTGLLTFVRFDYCYTDSLFASHLLDYLLESLDRFVHHLYLADILLWTTQIQHIYLINYILIFTWFLIPISNFRSQLISIVVVFINTIFLFQKFMKNSGFQKGDLWNHVLSNLDVLTYHQDKNRQVVCNSEI